MSMQAVAEIEAPGLWHQQGRTAAGLLLGLAVLAWLFHAEISAAAHNWITSTAYNHCFLVIPIAGYLIWERRDTLRGAVAAPMPLAALAGIPLATVWLIAERLGIMEGRQLIAVTFVELLIFTVLGWRLWWMLSGPLLYLYFLVPFGEFLTPLLQDITTLFVRHGLDLLHIPAYIDGYTIEIPEGTFYVAEACAGLRFLIASIAFGFLYALLMYRSIARRTIFVLASVIVPVIANGMRAIGIVSLGHILGSAEAAATDHVLYGWIFFSLVILLLIVLGLPFRQDQPTASRAPQPVPGRAPQWGAVMLSSGAVIVVAALSPAMAMQLNHLPAADMNQAALPDFGPRCSDLPGKAPASPEIPGQAGGRRIQCDGLILDVQLAVLPARSTAASVLGGLRHLTRIVTAEDLDTETGWLRGQPEPRLWRVTRTLQVGPMVAWGLWLDGQPSLPSLATRVHLAWTSLAGTPIAPVVIAIIPEIDWSKTDASTRDTIQAQLASVLSDANLTSQIRSLATPH